MKRFNITVNGKAYDVQVEELAVGAPAPVAAAPAAAPAAPVAAAPVAPVAAPAAAEAAPSSAAGSVKVESPMPGTIWEIKAAVGQTVKAGDPLVVLEAMKMENDIVAPVDGVVAAIHVNKGDSVDTGSLLASMN